MKIELAYTREASLGTYTDCVHLQLTNQTICNIDGRPWCTASTTPPDFDPTPASFEIYPLKPPSFWDAVAVCYRSGTGQPWNCVHGAAVGLSSPQSLVECTHNP